MAKPPQPPHPTAATLPAIVVRGTATNFNARVRALIDEYYDGNVARAAREMRVSQRGLAKLYRGDVRNPRLNSVLAMIRTFPHEDPMWIVSGKPSVVPREFVRRQLAEQVNQVTERAMSILEATTGERSERGEPTDDSPYAADQRAARDASTPARGTAASGRAAKKPRRSGQRDLRSHGAPSGHTVNASHPRTADD